MKNNRVEWSKVWFLDHTKVVYTAEDEQGFTFRQINDEDAAMELA